MGLRSLGWKGCEDSGEGTHHDLTTLTPESGRDHALWRSHPSVGARKLSGCAPTPLAIARQRQRAEGPPGRDDDSARQEDAAAHREGAKGPAGGRGSPAAFMTRFLAKSAGRGTTAHALEVFVEALFGPAGLGCNLPASREANSDFPLVGLTWRPRRSLWGKPKPEEPRSPGQWCPLHLFDEYLQPH